ncbi:MAG: NAD(P)H-dependent oxidoreductase [Pseudomonadota bacterium]
MIPRCCSKSPCFDVIVMATPIYWWSFTAQIKMFIDRMFSLSKFPESGEIRTVLAGKTLALLATGGGGLAGNLELLERQWRQPAEMMGRPFHSCLFPDTPPEAGVLKDDPAAVEKAAAFGRLLAA